ncbi:histidine phosphotransferase family protein [Pseudooceanicola sp.]|uniref:histidine phosphotransferase family protein n=1 Tax=Pseudooceanicola sp. TaxID=1914328 RepID=UPI002606921D|nr:histidine phosphotransferase family protein [Pseudooceanicola sp.]MDF1855757.1 histidine phosphotransferase family protein [Pseudooceanicola sp.]
MWQSNHNLAALIGSRICHDLISPIGAICNGLELLSLAGKPISPEMALISESVENANARIRFLRVAFGLASPEQSIGPSEVHSILSDISVGNRVQFHWAPEGECPRCQVREVFLALQCFESAMPQGGTVTVTSAGDSCWEISGPADPNRPDPQLWQALCDPVLQAQIAPAQVQFALLPTLLTERGRRIAIETGDSGMVMRF